MSETKSKGMVHVAIREAAVKFREEIESIVIPGPAGKWSAYRITTTSERIGKGSIGKRYTRDSVTEGVATHAAIEKFAAGKPMGGTDLTVVSRDWLDAVRRDGFNQDKVPLWPKSNSMSNVPENFFLDVCCGTVTEDNLVRLDTGSHCVFSHDGRPLPVAMFIDYMGAGLHDGKYDLLRAAEILLKDDRVRIFAPERPFGRKSDEVNKKKASPKDCITPVPFYNCDKNHSAYIHAIFMPTGEDVVKMYEKQKGYKAMYTSTENYRALFDLDVLGLRAGGACLVNDFWGSVGDKE